MATFQAIGNLPRNQDERDKATASAAIIAAALEAGNSGISITDLIADLTESLPDGQAKYVDQGNVRCLCVGPKSVLTLEAGTTIRHRDAPRTEEE